MQKRLFGLWGGNWLVVLVCACANRQPPPEAREPALPVVTIASTPLLPSSLTRETDSISSPAAPSAQATALGSAGARSAVEPALPVQPALLDDQGQPLPQTDALPSLDSPSFAARVDALTRAIRHDQPESGKEAFFPVVAYEQVKAIANPARDWEYRLFAAYTRDIHRAHRELGRDAEMARFVEIEVPQDQARYMKPGSEGNRLGYFRVLRSRLRFEMPSGEKRSIEVTSMISWRGEWYVVHLHGFE